MLIEVALRQADAGHGKGLAGIDVGGYAAGDAAARVYAGRCSGSHSVRAYAGFCLGAFAISISPAAISAS